MDREMLSFRSLYTWYFGYINPYVFLAGSPPQIPEFQLAYSSIPFVAVPVIQAGYGFIYPYHHVIGIRSIEFLPFCPRLHIHYLMSSDLLNTH
jgi:hypothetical protein